MGIKKFLLLIVIFSFILFMGCSNQQDKNNKAVTTSAINQLDQANKNAQDALKTQLRENIICDISQDVNNGNFIGYVTNNSIKDIKDMTIVISFYDNDNSKLGEQPIIINGLNHDERFKINEIMWSKYKEAKTWKITDKRITFTDSDYN